MSKDSGLTNEFVSRAGKKLQFALDSFQISPRDKICADFGSSTGGFVDCLLQNGAKKIYSVDTAYGELAWKLRKDPRVVVMERTNAMHVVLPEKVELITVDVGWTPQAKILPNVFANLSKNGVVISLIKPHYEVTRAKIKADEIEEIVKTTMNNIENVGGKIVKIVESPILGEKGKNTEFLALISCTI